MELIFWENTHRFCTLHLTSISVYRISFYKIQITTNILYKIFRITRLTGTQIHEVQRGDYVYSLQDRSPHSSINNKPNIKHILYWFIFFDTSSTYFKK